MRLLWWTGSCIEAAEERNQRRVGTQSAEHWAAVYNVLTETSSMIWSPTPWPTSRLVRIIHRRMRTTRSRLKMRDARLQCGVCRPSCRLEVTARQQTYSTYMYQPTTRRHRALRHQDVAGHRGTMQPPCYTTSDRLHATSDWHHSTAAPPYTPWSQSTSNVLKALVQRGERQKGMQPHRHCSTSYNFAIFDFGFNSKCIYKCFQLVSVTLDLHHSSDLHIGQSISSTLPTHYKLLYMCQTLQLQGGPKTDHF